MRGNHFFISKYAETREVGFLLFQSDVATPLNPFFPPDYLKDTVGEFRNMQSVCIFLLGKEKQTWLTLPV